MLFKKINAWLHLWLGLASGVIVVILSITGCILVFEQEIKQLSYPWLHAKNTEGTALLPPSKLYEAVSAALPEKKINSVWYHGENRTAQVTLNSDSMVYVNPYTAEVVAMVDHEDFFHFIDEGHFHLWMPEEIGEIFVGWGTLIFFLLLISGIILWWPKKWNKKGVDQSFKIRWKAKFKRVNYDLHNVLGFYALIIALLFAFTGLIMSFSWFNKGVYWMAGGKDTARIQAVSDSTFTGQTKILEQVDKAWNMARHELGEFNPDEVIVSFPQNNSAAIYVCTDMKNGIWRDIYLDQFTLKQLPASQSKIKDADLATWLRRSNFSLHVGAIGGLPTKILFFLASLICASLPVTGFYIWWGKKKKSAKRTKPKEKQLITA
ncbi:PepSY-associated TM helix [compost metagenome]